MMRKWCLGTFQDLRGPVMSTVNVQSFLDTSRHIDQSFIRFWMFLLFIQVHVISLC